MNTVDVLLLSFCGVGLGAASGYVFWVRYRVVSFRADLAEVYFALYERMASLQTLDDEAYAACAERITALASFADQLCLPLMFAFSGNAPAPRSSLRPEVDAAIREADLRVSTRLGRYLVYETLSGLLISAILWALPRDLFRKGVERRTAEVVEVAEPFCEVAAVRRNMRNEKFAGVE